MAFGSFQVQNVVEVKKCATSSIYSLKFQRLKQSFQTSQAKASKPFIFTRRSAKTLSS